MVRTLSRAAEASSRAERSRSPAKILTTSSNTRTASTAPNPTYSFLPIFITKPLRGLWPFACEKSFGCGPRSFARKFLVRETKFDYLSGLFWSWHELPFLDRVLAGLHQQRVTADDFRAAYMAVRSNHHLDFPLAAPTHPFRYSG